MRSFKQYEKYLVKLVSYWGESIQDQLENNITIEA